MSRRVNVSDVMHQLGRLDLPWDLEPDRLDPVFEITAADVLALTEELHEPECALTLAELEAVLYGVRRALPPSPPQPASPAAPGSRPVSGSAPAPASPPLPA